MIASVAVVVAVVLAAIALRARGGYYGICEGGWGFEGVL